MASYGKIRETTILGQAGTTWFFQLWKKDYTGSVSDITLEGDGFTVKWDGQGSTRVKQFVKSDCMIKFTVKNTTDESLLYDIFESGDRKYFVRIYKNTISNKGIWWFGWVNPSFSKFQNQPFPYSSSVKASDSLGTFSKQKESTLLSSEYNSTFNMNSHIKGFGDDMGLYDNPINLVIDGDFPLPNNNWTFGSSWSIPTGGGQIDFDGGSGAITQSGVSITQGEDVSFSFTIENLAEGDSISIALANQNGTHLFAAGYVTYTSNGNYVIQGDALQNATGVKILPGSTGDDTFSLTDASIIDGLITNQSPCPTNNDWFSTSIDWWRNGEVYQSNDPFYLYRTAKTPFRKDVETYPSKYRKYDVLKGSLKVFNTIGFLSDGNYRFIQPNSYQGNTDGQLPFYEYKSGDEQDTTSVIVDNLVTLDGTLNTNKGVVMGGSSVVYEPPFKSVSAKFKNISPTLAIATQDTGVDYSDYKFIGNVQQDLSTEGNLNINLKLWHQELLLASEVQANLTTDYDLANHTFKTRFQWQVKLTDGVNDYWLTRLGNVFDWVTTEPDNEFWCGYNFGTQDGIPTPSNNSVSTENPCAIFYSAGDTYYTTRTRRTRAFSAPLPPITGAILIKVTGINDYYQYKPDNTNFGDVISFTEPATIIHSNFLDIGSQITDSNSDAINAGQEGITYFSNQTETIAEENLELGDIIIGNTGSTDNTSTNLQNQFNVQYLNASGDETNIVGGFRRGGTGAYTNVTQLLCNEFISLQDEPLEILQASVFSPSISPLKFLKYSINNDANFKYYSFLGGSFKAQSETMEGEWFKVIDYNDPNEVEEIIEPKFKSVPTVTLNEIDDINLTDYNTTKHNALGESLEIISGTLISKINFTGTLLGKVYDGQKLMLRPPIGSRSLIVTVNGDKGVGATAIDIDSVTPTFGLPEGATLSVLTYDLSNVITPGTSTPNLYKGVTTTEIYIKPQDFSTWNNTGRTSYSRDDLGSVQPSGYGSRVKVYASTFIPIGYQVVSVDVYSSQNRSLATFTSRIISDTTVAQGTGTANTTITLATPWASVLGEYFIISYEIGASTDEIYGAKLTIIEVP